MVHEVLELFAGFEEGNFLRGHFNFRTRLRIAPGAAATFARAETAETANLDLIVGLKRANDALENRFDDRLSFFARQFGDASDLFHEVSFRHRMIFFRVLSRSLS